MQNKIFVVCVYITMLCFLFGCYLFAGWKGLAATIVTAIFYGLIALIVKRDRDVISNELDRCRAEVHNLRLTIADYQETVYLANRMLQKYGMSVGIPTMRETILRSVFDKK